MTKRKLHMIEGQELTKAEAEAKYGLKLQNLFIRIKRGIPLDTPVRTYGRRIAVEYNGKTYRSIAYLAEALDIQPTRLSTRIRKGMTAQDAVTAILANCVSAEQGSPTRSARPQTFDYPTHYTHQGRTLTPAEWAEEAGLPTARVRDRLLAGWTVARAISEPLTGTAERAAIRRERAAFIAKASAAFAPSKTVKLRFPNPSRPQTTSKEI